MAKLNIRSKIVAGYVTILVCLMISIAAIIVQINSLQKEIEYLSTHDLAVHNMTNELEIHFLDMISGQRGYAITGNPTFLDTYKLGLAQWEKSWSELSVLLSDNSKQIDELQSIHTLIKTWVSEAGEYLIQLKDTGTGEEVVEFYNSGVGLNYINDFRRHIDNLRAHEKELTQQRIDQMDRNGDYLQYALYAIFVLLISLSLVIAVIVSKSIANSINEVTAMIKRIASRSGDYSQRVRIQSHDEIGSLGEATNELIDSHANDNWVQSTAKEVIAMYQGITDLTTLTERYLSKLAELFHATYGVFYMRSGRGQQERLVKAASFAAHGKETGVEQFQIGESLVGQSAKEHRIFVLEEIPADYVRVASGLGEMQPRSLLIAPIEYEGETVAVLELAGLEPFSDLQLRLLDELLESFGTTLHSVSNRMEIERLLQDSQSLSEELQTQSEELQMQQEELRMTNEQLEEQNRNVILRSNELDQIRIELERYTMELEQSSQYKSEFLANMSHELRTPLNSMLILSQMLYENSNGNLDDEERKYAQVIHEAGSELLVLINDILDLSKVEAGKLDIVIDALNIRELTSQMMLQFQKVAEQKGLTFTAEADSDVPDLFYSDEQRMHQIVRNLLSNAFKFTHEGEVHLRIRNMSEQEWSKIHYVDYESFEDFVGIAIDVTDTGIGIANDKHAQIFEAFHQGDGRTSRKYGGTGLGLSISRELARLLNGNVVVKSELGKGSTFTLYLPSIPIASDGEALLYHQDAGAVPSLVHGEAAPAIQADDGNIHTDEQNCGLLEDDQQEDHGSMFSGKKVLVADDDVRNVFVLMNSLEKRGMKVITAHDGRECIEELEKHPDVNLVLMDIMMPVMDGYEAMKLIRSIERFANLPIIALTAKAMKQDRKRCLEAGASDYISKPINMEQLYSIMRVWLSK